jgi:hypothetical protein
MTENSQHQAASAKESERVSDGVRDSQGRNLPEKSKTLSILP